MSVICEIDIPLSNIRIKYLNTDCNIGYLILRNNNDTVKFIMILHC